ncbi:MAG: AMP-binding protein [Micrococcales bacterium]|nr:AMP-binding protein [Micrococcales bacterium]
MTAETLVVHHRAPAEIVVPDEPLTAVLERAVREHPGNLAIDFMGAKTTYAELAAQIAQAAGALHRLGVRAGDRVALVMPNCTSHVVAFWAALRLGAVVVEHNPLYGTEALAHQLANSGATVVLAWEKAVPAVLEAKPQTEVRRVVAVDLSQDLPTTSRLALRLPLPKARAVAAKMRGPVPAHVPHWHRLVATAEPIGEDVPRPVPTDLALLQYTGGTTGTPKGAMITHRNLVANAVQGQAWTGSMPGQDVIYGILPFFHAFGLMLCLVYPAQVAGTVVVFPSFDPDQVMAAQRRRPGTFMPAVPPMLDRLVDASERTKTSLTSFRYALCGAMAMSAETAKRWERATDGLAVEGYGMTETSPVALGSPLTDDRRPGALGIPFPSTRIRIVDPDTLSDVAPGERGELLIAGPQVFSGYWNESEETAHQLLPDGWLRTGDLVRMDDDGYVYLVDRIKEVIVTGGFKVYPSQVEDHLRDMEAIADVAVVGVPAGERGESVVAAIVLKVGHTVDLAAVREWGEQRLARYALPKKLVVLTELPRSQVGKVLRRVVRENVLRRDDDDQPHPERKL